MHVCTNGKSRFYFCFCFHFCEFNKLNVLLPERTRTPNGTRRNEGKQTGKNLDEFPKICWDTPVRHTHTHTHPHTQTHATCAHSKCN